MGMTVGGMLALYWAWRFARSPGDAVGLDPETVRTIAAGAILADPTLRRYPLTVRSIGPGILDVHGTVETESDAERVLATIRRGPGVRTVLNRIDVAPVVAAPLEATGG